LESADEPAANLPIWRGSIEQVGTNRRIYFSELSEVIDFIEKQIRLETVHPASGFHKWSEKLVYSLKAFWRFLLKS
jgi:hypothetical protein